MTKQDKRFEKIIRGNQKYYRFSDIKNFLEYYHFETEANGSSHYIFRRNPYPHITIVTHNNKIKNYYIKRAVQILRYYKILK